MMLLVHIIAHDDNNNDNHVKRESFKTTVCYRVPVRTEQT